jgi:hypothetical protein
MLAMNSRRRTMILLVYGKRIAIQSATSMKRCLLTPSARLFAAENRRVEVLNLEAKGQT